jgi:hypothetical protein
MVKYTLEQWGFLPILIKENSDETGARLKHLPCKSLTQLAQQAQVSTKAARKVTKKLHLLLYTIMFKHLKKAIQKNSFL